MLNILLVDQLSIDKNKAILHVSNLTKEQQQNILCIIFRYEPLNTMFIMHDGDFWSSALLSYGKLYEQSLNEDIRTIEYEGTMEIINTVGRGHLTTSGKFENIVLESCYIKTEYTILGREPKINSTVLKPSTTKLIFDIISQVTSGINEGLAETLLMTTQHVNCELNMKEESNHIQTFSSN